MGDLDRIVNVTISQAATVPSVEAFNDILIVDEFLKATPSPAFNERVREYASLAEIATAGFATTSYVYRAAQRIFAQSPKLSRVFVGRKLTGADGTETWTACLAAIVLENNAWYGLVVSTRLEAEQELVAAWVETAEKLCLLASADADIVDAANGEIATYLKTNNLQRTGVVYHPDAGDGTDEPCPEAAWMGLAFAYDPGTINWAYKTLALVTSYSLTPTQINRAIGKYANIYTSIAGVDATQYGRTGSGEYLDVVHGMDWLVARIQQRIFAVLVQQPKIPFTDAGIDIIKSELQAALEEGVAAGVINEDYTITVPRASAVSSVDKADRLLPDVNFYATLTGAINKTTIVGVVTV